MFSGGVSGCFYHGPRRVFSRAASSGSLLTHFFRSKLLEKNRKTFYKALYLNALLKPTDPVHLDSVAASVAMIRLSFFTLFGKEKDCEEAENLVMDELVTNIQSDSIAQIAARANGSIKELYRSRTAYNSKTSDSAFTYKYRQSTFPKHKSKGGKKTIRPTTWKKTDAPREKNNPRRRIKKIPTCRMKKTNPMHC